ncbi:MAG: hypothetical protein KC502_12850 [Myxococcales bacterium]|nr:hypothetical protein [Myxococcales bacterium]
MIPNRMSAGLIPLACCLVVAASLTACAGEDGSAAAASGTTDAGEWWAVDVPDSGTADTGSTGGGEVDKTCYDACIGKGQSDSVCKPACSGKGDKPSGKVDQKCYDGCLKAGGSAAICTKKCPVKLSCYDSCISKKLTPAACKTGCACLDTCPKGKDCGCFGSKGGGGGEVDKTCYDGCLKKGESKETCTKACPAKTTGEVDQTCYDGCLKKGESKETCTKACPAKSGGDATWANVHSKIIKPMCAGGYCHGGGSGSLKLTGDAKADFTMVRTKMAGNQEASKCTELTLVFPGKPEKSLLWLKTTKGQAHGCGKKMPKGSDGLSASDSNLIKDWITAGAKQ